jgi:hypothetical protein
MVDDTVGGLLRILGSTALAVVVVGGVFYARGLARRSVRVGRRLHLVPQPPPVPMGPPLERVARDLRRLRPEALRHRQGTANAKHRGVVLAYDDLLLEACRAVEVQTSLGSLPEGLERESERLRIEYELERAGVLIRTRR